MRFLTSAALLLPMVLGENSSDVNITNVTDVIISPVVAVRPVVTSVGGPSCTITTHLLNCTVLNTDTECEDLQSVVPPSECGNVTFHLVYEIINTSKEPVNITSAEGSTIEVKVSGPELVGEVDPNPIPAGFSTVFTQDLTNINACHGLSEKTITLSSTVKGRVNDAPNKVTCGAFEALNIFTFPYTASPTKSPTTSPTKSPTASPTKSPTASPTKSPTQSPTSSPTVPPTKSPTTSPTKSPTASPTTSPTASPTKSPTASPTGTPTKSPTASPTSSPTASPTKSPTTSPTKSPTTSPTKTPTVTPTYSPSPYPTERPTYKPTKRPTKRPTRRPTRKPTPQPCPYGPNYVYTSHDPYCTPDCLYVGGIPYKNKCGCYCYITD